MQGFQNHLLVILPKFSRYEAIIPVNLETVIPDLVQEFRSGKDERDGEDFTGRLCLCIEFPHQLGVVLQFVYGFLLAYKQQRSFCDPAPLGQLRPVQKSGIIPSLAIVRLVRVTLDITLPRFSDGILVKVLQ